MCSKIASKVIKIIMCIVFAYNKRALLRCMTRMQWASLNNRKSNQMKLVYNDEDWLCVTALKISTKSNRCSRFLLSTHHKRTASFSLDCQGCKGESCIDFGHCAQHCLPSGYSREVDLLWNTNGPEKTAKCVNTCFILKIIESELTSLSVVVWYYPSKSPRFLVIVHLVISPANAMNCL